jgi:hypothetical protein
MGTGQADSTPIRMPRPALFEESSAMRCFVRGCLLLPALLCLLTSGCGSGNRHGSSTFAPVSGRVFLDSSPLAHALVRFSPVNREGSPPDSYGETDEQGAFTLKPALHGGGDVTGAIVGEHRVEFSIFDRQAEGGPRERLPAKLNRDSKERFVVPPEGTTEANFTLTSR